MSVTAAAFTGLGARPLIGRTFEPGEDQPGRTPSVVIGERLWERRYRRDSGILGKTILLNGRPFAVIGVMPASFRIYVREAEVWTILTLNPPNRRGPFFMQGLARLKPGVTVEQAAAELEVIARDTERTFPANYRNLRYPVIPFLEVFTSDIRRLLLIMQAAVLLVLLIAIANVANLHLARAAGRHREMAIRLSIGAGRGDLIRQLLVESSVLSFIAGALGSLLAWWAVQGLKALRPAGLPRIDDIAVDIRVLLFTLAISLVAGIVFGFAPAISTSRAGLAGTLKQGARGGTDSRGNRRIRGALVVSEVALCVILLVGAGLLIRSFAALGKVDPGFSAPPDRVLSMLVSPTGQKYTEQPQLWGYWEQVLERVRALPGVESASVALNMPPNRISYTDSFAIEGRPAGETSRYPAVSIPHVSVDYLSTLGVRLLRGRFFDARDTLSAPRVIVISETLARNYFAGEDPVGKRMKHGGPDPGSYSEIIGVVADVSYHGLEEPSQPIFYYAAAQMPARPMWVLVRTAVPAANLTNAVLAAIRSVDRDIPVARVATLSQVMASSVETPRFRSLLMVIFAGAALLLAAVGIYGVIAYSVTQRTQEIGIRMALGATPAGVRRLVISQGSGLTLAGIAIGLAGALALSRVLDTLVFGVSTRDPATFIVVALILAGVAVLASYIPARRASAIDPVSALRQE
jgi:putative ABC transport system permease protein